MARELGITIGVWVALCVLALALTARDLSAPGLYYDEVVQAVPALDLLDAGGKPLRIPGASSVRVFGRWLPLFTQPYMGALKSQLLAPSFAVFDASAASLRLTTLAWSLLGVLFAMLFARHLFGLGAALLAGALLAVDPSFLFVSRHDWGSFSLAFLLRCAGLYAFATGWSSRSHLRTFAAGLCFGLGVYNKIDFAVPLAATALALALAAPRAVAAALRTQARHLVAPAAGFALGAAPMLGALGRTLRKTRAFAAHPSAGEWGEKLGALRTMLDGSYFDRLMLSGGSFERMFEVEGAAVSAFLAIYALAMGFVAARLALGARRGTFDPARAFVLAAALLASVGILLTPLAVRIHHVLGVYPFPQMLVAVALVDLAGERGTPRRAARLAATALLGALALGGSWRASMRTLGSIERTHGKGRWSDALAGFAQELAAEPAAVAVSLDWGFHAQLHFLDRSLRLREPIWLATGAQPGGRPPSLEGDADTVYLLYDRDFAVFPVGPALLEVVQQMDPGLVVVERHLDREGDPAFVSIRIRSPHRIVYRGASSSRPIELELR